MGVDGFLSTKVGKKIVPQQKSSPTSSTVNVLSIQLEISRTKAMTYSIEV